MKKFREQMQYQLDFMQQSGKLFRSSVTGDAVWEAYLNSFENDKVFRDPNSTEHNCNHCNNFIRRYGNIVSIDENDNIITLFDFVPTSEEYIPVNAALRLMLRNALIQDVFIETFDSLKSLPYEAFKRPQTVYRIGIHENVKRYTKEEADKYGVVSANQVVKFEHMSLFLDKAFVRETSGSIEAIQATYRDAKNVFKRTMEEISLDTLELVRDLINQGSLLDGDTHLGKIEIMIPLVEKYQEVVNSDNWCWKQSYGFHLATFRNSLIGVLCTELAEGMDLNRACQNWNKRVDPINYMKTVSPISEKQIKEAQIFVEDNGYTTAFSRRPATIDDIKANAILHLNAIGGSKTKEVHLFDKVTPTKSSRHKRSEFDKIEEVSIDKFMYDILPTCTAVEAFLDNSHEDNMVTMTTSKNKDSKQIFKWSNNFSWTFNGNLAGKSMIKNAVKQLGGKVDGVLRFSIMWANGDQDNTDLDAHCEESPGDHIYFGHKKSESTSGNLDIDITQPQDHIRRTKENVVENITYPNYPPSDMSFKFYVNNYANRGSRGFTAEIEFLGVQYQYEYPRGLSQSENIQVATIHYKNGQFEIEHKLTPIDGFGVEKEFYNLKTGHFHKVNLLCLSPNHWDENEIGNKYYFLFLENAQANQSLRSFHNENLKGDLVVHRKVMEVLANTTMVDSSIGELSGIGFNSTVRDEVVLRLTGSHKRMVRVKF